MSKGSDVDVPMTRDRCGSIVAVLILSAAAPAAQEIPADFLITLERTFRTCGGECPAYTVTIDAHGAVTYDGERYVRVAGRATDRIPLDQVRALAETVEQIGFFALQDRYWQIPNPDGTAITTSHSQTSLVTVRRNGQSKRVEDRFGAPSGLIALERQIDAIVRIQRWIRIDATTLRQMVASGTPPSAEQKGEYLQLAIYADEVDVIEALLDIGADPLVLPGEAAAPPLMIVRSAAAARALLDAGADPLVRTEHGGTPLGWAASLEAGVVDVLLKAGVPADFYVDRDNSTALIYAAGKGNVAVIRRLLAAGADPHRRGRSGTALDAARGGQARARQQRIRIPEEYRPSMFVEDFDGTVAALQQALARRPR